jgi:hypothetical protein
MQQKARDLTISSLRAILEMRRSECELLTGQFEAEHDTDQKTLLAYRWNRSMKERRHMQYILDILQREPSTRDGGSEDDDNDLAGHWEAIKSTLELMEGLHSF